MTYSVVVQAGPDEILEATDSDSLNLADLMAWPSISDVLVALPDIEHAAEAAETLSHWGVRSLVGDAYNRCNRILTAHEKLPEQEFSVRVLATWKHICLDYVDRMVADMVARPCDFVTVPRDFDVTMAADVASLEAIRRIGDLPGVSQEVSRAHFNPWGYMEMHPDLFEIRHLEPAPAYDEERCSAILAQERCHPENEYFGRDYAGSRYHYLAPLLPPEQRILDIACGSGAGTELLSRTAELAIGVDYLASYVDKARTRYPESNRLQYLQGDGQAFLLDGKEGQFDLVVSLHTLEHVPDDAAMVANLFRNLCPGGRLVAEVPLLAERPIGKPINPYHLREYRIDEFLELLKGKGFLVEDVVGVCRGFYGSLEQARDAVQVHAVRPV